MQTTQFYNKPFVPQKDLNVAILEASPLSEKTRNSYSYLQPLLYHAPHDIEHSIPTVACALSYLSADKTSQTSSPEVFLRFLEKTSSILWKGYYSPLPGCIDSKSLALCQLISYFVQWVQNPDNEHYFSFLKFSSLPSKEKFVEALVRLAGELPDSYSKKGTLIDAIATNSWNRALQVLYVNESSEEILRNFPSELENLRMIRSRDFSQYIENLRGLIGKVATLPADCIQGAELQKLWDLSPILERKPLSLQAWERVLPSQEKADLVYLEFHQLMQNERFDQMLPFALKFTDSPNLWDFLHFLKEGIEEKEAIQDYDSTLQILVPLLLKWCREAKQREGSREQNASVAVHLIELLPGSYVKKEELQQKTHQTSLESIDETLKKIEECLLRPYSTVEEISAAYTRASQGRNALRELQKIGASLRGPNYTSFYLSPFFQKIFSYANKTQQDLDWERSLGKKQFPLFLASLSNKDLLPHEQTFLRKLALSAPPHDKPYLAFCLPSFCLSSTALSQMMQPYVEKDRARFLSFLQEISETYKTDHFQIEITPNRWELCLHIIRSQAWLSTETRALCENARSIEELKGYVQQEYNSLKAPIKV